MSEETNFETRRRKVGLFIILKLPVIVKAPVTSWEFPTSKTSLSVVDWYILVSEQRIVLKFINDHNGYK